MVWLFFRCLDGCYCLGIEGSCLGQFVMSYKPIIKLSKWKLSAAVLVIDNTVLWMGYVLIQVRYPIKKSQYYVWWYQALGSQCWSWGCCHQEISSSVTVNAIWLGMPLGWYRGNVVLDSKSRSVWCVRVWCHGDIHRNFPVSHLELGWLKPFFW